MEKILFFIAHYNAQIIQFGFAIVFLLIIIYVYRAFFISESSTATAGELGHSPALEQKLNQLLEQHKLKSSATNSAEEPALNNEVEIDNLKTEIYNLRQQLNENKKSDSSVDTDADSNNVEAAALLTGKVKELESRLAEYEIIADDIAELSQLRADNALMKEKLSQLQSGGSEAANTVVSPTTDTTVPVPEQDLLNDFEKNSQKKDNE